MPVSPKPSADDNFTFKVKPRLLTLLGDQLIRDANLAVFELVKNAYDARQVDRRGKIGSPDAYYSKPAARGTDPAAGQARRVLRNATGPLR